MQTKLRSIAIHLPQFHPIPENDEWWGKGFTEWTNVTKATPRFKGHYQPHLPADLGFYDLRLEEARLAQEALAKEYGIYGFCYYHYWFNGKRILHEPVDRKLKNPKEDLPFMLCWANENWTRRWDGGDESLLLSQEYSDSDDKNHIRFLIMNYFLDERYIKIHGKPVFCVYKSQLLPNMKRTLEIWRNEAKMFDLDLYICRFETYGFYGKDYFDEGFDAAIEFQPNSPYLDKFIRQLIHQNARNILYKLKYRYYSLRDNKEVLKSMKNIKKIDYENYINYLIDHYQYPDDYTYFPCVTPSWDNSARRGQNAFLFYNSNPEIFSKWIAFHKKNYLPISDNENLFFINAWNEWAEGNHLEPDIKWGRGYLEALSELRTR